MPGGVPFAVDRFRCTAPARRCDGSYPCCPTALHPLRHVRSASALYRTRSTCQRAPPAASDGLQGYLRPPIDIAAGLIRAALPPCSYQGASTVLLPCTAPDRHRRGSYPPGIARRVRTASALYSPRSVYPQALPAAGVLPCRPAPPPRRVRTASALYSTRSTKISRRGRPRRDIFRLGIGAYLSASATATAQATVAPTMGLLPMPIRPIISTCAGTEDEPANCASPCIRPMESVRP